MVTDRHVDVKDLLDTNAGDEYHLDENWTACPGCGRDVPADYAACWSCGTAMEGEQ